MKFIQNKNFKQWEVKKYSYYFVCLQ
jgi:hypothetical protein